MTGPTRVCRGRSVGRGRYRAAVGRGGDVLSDLAGRGRRLADPDLFGLGGRGHPLSGRCRRRRRLGPRLRFRGGRAVVLPGAGVRPGRTGSFLGDREDLLEVVSTGSGRRPLGGRNTLGYLGGGRLAIRRRGGGGGGGGGGRGGGGGGGGGAEKTFFSGG